MGEDAGSTTVTAQGAGMHAGAHEASNIYS